MAVNDVVIDYHTKSIQIHVMDDVCVVVGTKRCSDNVREAGEYVSRYWEVASVAIKGLSNFSSVNFVV